MTKRRGFTLLELLVAFFLATVMFGGVITLFLRVSDYRGETRRTLRLVRTASGVFRQIRRDLEGAYDGEDPFHWEDDVQDRADLLRFWTATANPYGLTGTAGEVSHEILHVEYTLADGVLLRKTDRSDLPAALKAPRVLARGVRSFTVQPLKADGNKVTVPDSSPPPRAVQVRLVFYTRKGRDLDGNGTVDAAEDTAYLKGQTEAQALGARRLKAFYETIDVPAGDAP